MTAAKRKVIPLESKNYADKVKQRAYDIYMEEKMPVLGRIADKVGVTLEEVRTWWLEDKWNEHKTARQYSLKQLITEQEAELYKMDVTFSRGLRNQINKRLASTTDPDELKSLSVAWRAAHELTQSAFSQLKKHPNWMGD